MFEKAIEILEKAKTLIEDKSRWTTKAFARDRQGKICFYYSPEACQWCAEGAIGKAFTEVDFKDRQERLKVSDLIYDVYNVAYQDMWVEVNDDLGHEAVMKLFDDEIERIKHERDAQQSVG